MDADVHSLDASCAPLQQGQLRQCNTHACGQCQLTCLRALQKLYVTMFPCNECAKLLIQAGVKEVIFYEASVGSIHVL